MQSMKIIKIDLESDKKYTHIVIALYYEYILEAKSDSEPLFIFVYIINNNTKQKNNKKT